MSTTILNHDVLLTRSISGSKTGKLLPTGSVVNTLDDCPATCIDVGNPCVFVLAEDLGIAGGTLPDDIAANEALLTRLETIRRAASVAMGLSQDSTSAPASIPKIAMVSAPHQHSLLSGAQTNEHEADLVVRSMSVGQPHRAVPITVAMALAAAATLEGSVVQNVTSTRRVDDSGITVSHPGGRLLVSTTKGADGLVERAIVFRTARKIMDGLIYV